MITVADGERTHLYRSTRDVNAPNKWLCHKTSNIRLQLVCFSFFFYVFILWSNVVHNRIVSSSETPCILSYRTLKVQQ